MENERNAQAAAQPAEEKKPVEEKKPGYPMHKRKYTPLYTIIVFLYGLLVKLLFFMKIEGRENVPKDRNCILMGNHQCLLDPVTLALCVPDREIHFMGKKELFENKALGWVFRQVHGFPVDRGNMDMTHEQGNLRRADRTHGGRVCPAERRKIASARGKNAGISGFHAKKTGTRKNIFKKI